MNNLARWLRRELEKRRITQNRVAVYAGVAQGTISEILNKGHVPKVETLFRLADYFETPREDVLRLVGHLPARQPLPDEPVPLEDEDDFWLREAVEEFRKLPDGWKEAVVHHVTELARLAEQPPYRIIGDEEEKKEEEAGSDQETSQADAPPPESVQSDQAA